MKIGILLQLAESDAGVAPRYPEIRDAALGIERDGFDSLWVADHLLFEWDEQRRGIWEGWTILSALAEATSRVEIGAPVLCTAFRNPGLAAKMADAVDEVSVRPIASACRAGRGRMVRRSWSARRDRACSG